MSGYVCVCVCISMSECACVSAYVSVCICECMFEKQENTICRNPSARSDFLFIVCKMSQFNDTPGILYGFRFHHLLAVGLNG